MAAAHVLSRPKKCESPLWVLDPSRVKDEQLVYGTYLGGSGNESGYGVSLDIDGTVTIVGTTLSLDFPTTPNAYSRTIVPSQGSDGFVTRLDPRQRGPAQLVYSTFFGGRSAGDGINSVVSRHGLITVSGLTLAADLPTTPGSFARTQPGGTDIFVAQFDTVVSRLLYSTYLGGSSDEGPWHLTMNENGEAIVVGSISSFDYPTTPNAFDRTYGANGLGDGFLTQLDMQADGLVRFGAGTRGCTGPILLRGTTMPRMGHVGFSLLCTNAPPGSAGALLLAERRLQSPIVLMGAALWVDPTGGLVVVPVASDALQRSDAPLPIPQRPELIGAQMFAQALWVGPSLPAPCPPLGLSTSFGLEVTVQP